MPAEDVSRVRERLSDLNFAMRIITKQYAEDMTILLSRADAAEDPAVRSKVLRQAAQRSSEVSQQVMRYTRMVESGLRKRL